MLGSRRITRTFESTAHAALLAVSGLTLVAAGQPLFTDDLWWHLALGSAYAQVGPWLDADPLLFTSSGPPVPAAWLSDLALSSAEASLGLAGLRLLHVLLVSAILGLVWSLIRSVGASRWGASAATAVFAAMAAYRLVQLRPHLATILATLIVYRLLLEGTQRPTRTAFAATLVLLGVWANLHGGFLVGPAMLFAAALASLVQLAVAPDERRAADRRRGLALGVTFLLGLAATGLNPSGFDRHTAFLSTNPETPQLSIVLDEWSGIDPFAWPVPDLPPSPLTWLLFWGLCLVTLPSAVAVLRRFSRQQGPEPARDLTLVLLAAGALAAMIFAVRFTWLCVFPLLLIASSMRDIDHDQQPNPTRRLVLRLAALALLPAFVWFGAWPMLSRGIPIDSFAQSYQPAYPPGKYHANAVWFMADSGLTGNLFNEYVVGGFVGFWLAPELRGFVNGTLNVPPATMEASRAIREARGQEPGESFLELLDRYEIDAFMGIGVPALPRGTRPVSYSTTLLEGAPGWLLVFRDQRSAVYLRRNERNHSNLERVLSYYERSRVPFDPVQGLEPDRVIKAALPWAMAKGLVPYGIDGLREATNSLSPDERAAGYRGLAQSYAVIGLYEHSLRMDRRLLKLHPTDRGAQRRIAWALLRLGRPAEALRATEPLGAERLGGVLRSTAEALVSNPEDERALALVRRLPVLTAAEAANLSRATLAPELRASRLTK